MELATLEEHLDMIERQIASGEREAQDSFDAQVKALEPEDEGERQLLRDERYYHIEVVLPRVFRNPFLVSLFSVYETSVTEVARLLQRDRARESLSTTYEAGSSIVRKSTTVTFSSSTYRGTTRDGSIS